MNIEETITHLKNGKKMTICTLIRTFKKEGIENFVVTRKKYIETVLSELEKKEAIINEMAKAMNYSSGTICSCCNKKRNKTYKGFIWRYVNE